MALLVDGDINSLDDLKEWDSGVLDVAHGEGIDLGAKLRRAQAEVEEEIERFLRDQERGTLAQVVIDRGLKHWHALKTLEALYRDAYFNQLNDRYGAKWKHYLELADRQAGRYFDAGVAIVEAPLRRPAWVAVRLEDGPLAPASYRIQATAVDAQGRESAPCPVQVEGSPLPHSLLVSLPYAPEGAVGWNIYVSSDDGPTALQNQVPLGLEEEWTLPLTGVGPGRPPSEGQPADEVVRAGGSLLLRG
jgi:hypothetical protein